LCVYLLLSGISPDGCLTKSFPFQYLHTFLQTLSLFLFDFSRAKNTMPFVLWVSLVSLCAATETALGANPIRKVVNMLNMMSQKVEAEGKRNEKLFSDYMCFCKTNEAEVSKSIESATERIPQLQATVIESSSAKSQLQQELEDHKADRSEGQASLAKAMALREKENATFEGNASDSRTNIAALRKATKAIESNLAGSAFLQTNAAGVVKNILEMVTSITDEDRATVVSFLNTGSTTSGSSDEIVGILKTIAEEMQKDYEASVEAEAAQQKAYLELTAGKQKEIASATAMIEKKTERVGVLSVKVSEASDDLEKSS